MKPKSHHSIVAAIIPHHTDKDKILVFDHLKMGKTSLPVGKIDGNEDPSDAIIRELQEELGINATHIECLGNEIVDIEDIRMHVDTHIFLVHKYEGNIKNAEPVKHDNIRYLKATEILRLPRISHNTEVGINYLIKKAISSKL